MHLLVMQVKNLKILTFFHTLTQLQHFFYFFYFFSMARPIAPQNVPLLQDVTNARLFRKNIVLRNKMIVTDADATNATIQESNVSIIIFFVYSSIIFNFYTLS
jgi:hypothetical protein